LNGRVTDTARKIEQTHTGGKAVYQA